MALAAVAYGADAPAGDADRGRELFQRLGCAVCHSVDGRGGGYAADLAKRIGREQTPLDMAAGLWNRGPLMWAWMAKKRLRLPDPSEQQFADLFAYFYSARYFDRPGDATRGRAVFERQRCGECHGFEGPPQPGGSLRAWPPMADALALLERMWSAAAAMREALAKRRLPWPELTSQEAADLWALAAELREERTAPTEFPAGTVQSGERLFVTKGCGECHRGPQALPGRFSGRTLTDLGTAVWNHAPAMGPRLPQFSSGELRQLVGYLWNLQIREPPGDARRGRQVFLKQGCAACHGNAFRGAPRLAAQWLRPFRLMEAVWRHGPLMEKQLRESGRAWPKMTRAELGDLAAYLARSEPRSGL